MERFSLYKQVHKGIRSVVSGLVEQAGRTDFRSPEEVAQLKARLDSAFEVFESHAAHETEFITPVLVVCAGPKSVLDIDLTLEYLETRGVPVLGWQTTALAGFYARDSGSVLAGSVADGLDAARIASTHWKLGLSSGLLICVPLPAEAALSREEAESAIAQAVADSEAAGIHGPAATPDVLARVAALTDGRSVTANLALIENNARVAASIAVALAQVK